jgi:tRNA-dihydrouridine synthase 1
MDIIYQHVLDQGPPQRPPLYMSGDPNVTDYFAQAYTTDPQDPRKRKRANPCAKSPNLRGMQGHLFHLLKHMLSHQTHIRDALAKTTIGDMPAFEKVLRMLEVAVKQALDEDAATQSSGHVHHLGDYKSYDSMTPSERTMVKYKRPWWVCQPNIRILPEEALEKGAMQPSKKELRVIKQESMADGVDDMVRRDDGRQSSDKENEMPKDALFCG